MKRPRNTPVVIPVHDDRYFLSEVIQAYQVAGPVTVLVSGTAWNGDLGQWELCASVADSAGAEVIRGVWADETLHRRAALEVMRARGHQHIIIPDGDEVPSKALLDSLLNLASVNAADIVRVSMDTYWKSPRYRITPPERLRPVLMVNAQTCEHDHIREYVGPRTIVLGPDHGVLHHLSYAGPDERIERKIRTWGHRDEVGEDWYRRVWQGWDRDRLMRDLHPTHPTFYGCVERIPLPDVLAGCRDDVPLLPDIGDEKPKRWPTVSVIVPLYGGEEDTNRCLESLALCRHLLDEVVVIDDVSPDGAAEIAAGFDFVTLIKNDENRGFAATCNRGYEASTGEVVVFLNSDTVVPKAGLFRLIESLIASHTIGAAGPRTNYCGGPQRIEPTYSRLEYLELFAQDFAHRDVADQDASILIGFCLAARRTAIDEVADEPGKAFDERFGRGMFEDNDLSYRLLRAGYRLRIAERAFVHHEGNRSLVRSGDSFHGLLRRNEGLFRAKWWEDLETGYASHLPDHHNGPITFNQARHPDAVRKEMAALRDQGDISLCMIVRDEERVIGDCLRSTAGIFKQVVIVDTGSKDRTLEIISDVASKSEGTQFRVEQMDWPDSFADARNESLRHATGRWLFWMDADDTLPKASAEAILRAAVTAPPDVVGFVVPVRFVDGGAAGGTQVDHIKLFRNIPGIAFEGRIHEQVLSALRQTGGQIVRLDAVVLHSGYDTSVGGQAKKRTRDEQLLKLDLEDRPGHPFVLFNLGMTAHYLGEHAKAVDWLSQSIAVAIPQESHVRKAYSLLGVSKRERGDLEGALATFATGLTAVGEDPELRFQAAMVLTTLGRLEESRNMYLSMGTDVSGFFSSVDMAILGPKRFHNLSVVCLGLERYGEARDHLRTAIGMGFAPAAQLLFEAALSRDDFRTGWEAMEAWRSLDGRDPGWATALAALCEARGENPEPTLRANLHLVGAALVLARRQLARGEDPRGILEALDGDGIAEAAYCRGIAAMHRGDLEVALEHMRRARDLNPSHMPTLEQVGRLESTLYDQGSPLRCPVEDVERVAGAHIHRMGVSSCPVSVVVVTYNSSRTIEACLRSILATIGSEDELIVIDNCSLDDTMALASAIASTDHRLQVKQNDDNVGYAKGANQCLLASHGEYLVLLNPDTVVYPGWIDGLRSRLTDNVVAVGPVSDVIGGDQFVAKYLATRPSKEQLPQTVPLVCKGQTVTTKLLLGVCLMLPRWALDQYGLLDEGTELGADDLELSWRLRLLGHELAVACDVFVSHVGSVSFQTVDREITSERTKRSDAALLAKLRQFYGDSAVPNSWELWNSDIFEPAMATG